MSVRGFKYFAILSTNAPQPLIGTTLSAAINVPPQQQGFPPLTETLAVVDSSPFVPGDDAALLSSTGTKGQTVNVVAIPDATHITVQGIRLSYSAGDFLSLALNCFGPYVQAKEGNAGPLYIGAQYNFNPTTGLYMIAVVEKTAAGTQPYDFSSVRAGFADPEPMNNYWITGTAGDSYLPSANLV